MRPEAALATGVARPMGRALVVTGHPATLRSALLTLGAVGFQGRSVVGLGHLPQCRAGELQLAVVDLDLDPMLDAARLVDEVALRCPGALLVTVAGHDARQRLLRSLSHPAVGHALPKTMGAPGSDPITASQFDGPDERDLYVALRRRTDRTLPAAAGVAPYLAGIAEVSEDHIVSSDEKDAAVERVVALGERMQLQLEKLRRIETLTEELVTNALFDAPVDDRGARRHAPIGRGSRLSLAPEEAVQIRYGCDGRSFAVAVTDRFGSIDQRTVVEHLSKLLDPGGVRMEHGPGGAGIGLVMIYGAVNQLCFTVAPRRFTEVAAVVEVAGSNRASLERGTAIHFFVEPAEPLEGSGISPMTSPKTSIGKQEAPWR